MFNKLTQQQRPLVSFCTHTPSRLPGGQLWQWWSHPKAPSQQLLQLLIQWELPDSLPLPFQLHLWLCSHEVELHVQIKFVVQYRGNTMCLGHLKLWHHKCYANNSGNICTHRGVKPVLVWILYQQQRLNGRVGDLNYKRVPLKSMTILTLPADWWKRAW